VIYLDEKLGDHPKILAAAEALGVEGRVRAVGFYVLAIAYSRAYLTDGFLPFYTCGKLVENGDAFADLFASDEVGLFRKTDRGYLIHDYSDWQNSKAEVKQKQAQARERVQAFRQKRKGNGRLETQK